MRRSLLIGLAASSALALPVSNVEAQVPRFLTYQGVLTDANNLPVKNDTYNVTFRIYELESGGTPLYTENHVVQTQNGLFSAVLGERKSLDLAFDKGYWLTTTPQSAPEPVVRVRLTPAPYAFTAINADTAKLAIRALDADHATRADFAAPTGVAGGDLIGDYPNPTVKDGAISTSKIADGAITKSKLSANLEFPPSGPASGDLTGDYPNPKIAVSAVKTDRISDLAVTRPKIANGAIDSTKIAAGSISNSNLADRSVTGNKIALSTITPENLKTTPTTVAPWKLLMGTGANSMEWLDAPTAALPHTALHWDGTSLGWRKLTPRTFATETNATANTTVDVGANRLLVGIDGQAGGRQGWLNNPTLRNQILRFDGTALTWARNDSLAFPIDADTTINLSTGVNAMFRLTNSGNAPTAVFRNRSTASSANALVANQLDVNATASAVSVTNAGTAAAVGVTTTGTGAGVQINTNTGVALDAAVSPFATGPAARITHPGTTGSGINVIANNNTVGAGTVGIAVSNTTTSGSGITVAQGANNNVAGIAVTHSGSGAGVTASTGSGAAISGTTSGTGNAVVATANGTGNGVNATSTSGFGVNATTTNGGTAVNAIASLTGTGVAASAAAGPAVTATSAGGRGVDVTIPSTNASEAVRITQNGNGAGISINNTNTTGISGNGITVNSNSGAGTSSFTGTQAGAGSVASLASNGLGTSLNITQNLGINSAPAINVDRTGSGTGLNINNSGTGTGANIIMSSPVSNNSGLSVTHSGTGSGVSVTKAFDNSGNNNPGVDVTISGTSSTAPGMRVVTNANADALVVTQNGLGQNAIEATSGTASVPTVLISNTAAGNRLALRTNGNIEINSILTTGDNNVQVGTGITNPLSGFSN